MKIIADGTTSTRTSTLKKADAEDLVGYGSVVDADVDEGAVVLFHVLEDGTIEMMGEDLNQHSLESSCVSDNAGRPSCPPTGVPRAE